MVADWDLISTLLLVFDSASLIVGLARFRLSELARALGGNGTLRVRPAADAAYLGC
jgi:hypothetical protein